MRRVLLALTLWLATPALPARAADPRFELGPESERLDGLKRELQQIDARLQIVEKQYSYRQEPDEEDVLRRRYSDGEIQFLLNNFTSASVLFYDLIGSAAFKGMREYPDALYMLAESLYQQQNFLGARMYFREHMNARGSHYRDALARYLEISGRINEFTGIDQYIDRAKGEGGALPTDIAYVYAKWLFRRTDVPEKERIARARTAFQTVADAQEAFQLQAEYFLGVLSLQEGDLEKAAAGFERVRALPAKDERDKKVHEHANLALGRVYFELGKFTEALDRYQEIDYHSESFVDALYEISWTHVRRARDGGKDEYEKARQACEKLLLSAPDSVLAPEAKILEGQLLLKLGKYQEATETYTAIINEYLEVYDNIDGRLKAHSDPAQYFQQLIAEQGKTFDINALLPPIAVKWATTQRDVSEAVAMTNDIDLSRQGVTEASEIAGRLLDVLDSRRLEVFPQMQEGLSRAEAVDSGLARLESELVAMEERLLGPERVARLQKDLGALRKERAALEQRFQNLPKNEQELDARKKKMLDKMGELDQAAYRLGYQMESLYAVITAVEKWVADTRDQRVVDPSDEREFAERMKSERQVADQLREELAELQRKMRDEKARLSLLGGGVGDAALRVNYEQLLKQEKDLLAMGRSGLEANALAVLKQVDEVRLQIEGVKERSRRAKASIIASVQTKGDAIREKVRAEADRLKEYDGEVGAASRNAKGLVGSIAFESFKRVRRQFYELVLKADVGLVDVAWTRKQDKTNEIQNLAKQKEKELKGLDEEFKEVLKEVE